jgi:hypothetical protein
VSSRTQVDTLSYYTRLRDNLKEMVRETVLGTIQWDVSVYHVVAREPSLLRQIAFLAQTVFDCSFLIVSRSSSAA